jgi:hypothetical protein
MASQLFEKIESRREKGMVSEASNPQYLVRWRGLARTPASESQERQSCRKRRLWL